MADTVQKIGIVGAGLIGASWAAFYASKGFAVQLYDADANTLHNGRENTLLHLESLRDYGLLEPDDYERAVGRVAVTNDLATAVQAARLVQESVTEQYGVKKEVLHDIDRFTDPTTVVASSSSGLLISELQNGLGHPERCLIAHPFNPPHLIPLVELVPGPLTDPQTLLETKSFFESLGKTAIVLKKEVPGHVANRLQAAVWREAIQLVLDGVVSVEDVDRALTAGPGLRWALLGPHLIFHLAGGPGGIKNFIDHIGGGWDEVWQDLACWTALPATTTETLVTGVAEEIGDRQVAEIAKWRDKNLVQILKAVNDV